MSGKTPVPPDDAIDLGPGPYDGAPGDPWFLPGPPDEAPEGPAAGMPAAGRSGASRSGAGISGAGRSGAWAAAEAGLAADLAALAFDQGRLAGRIAGLAPAARPGALTRLALEEAAALSWWTGERIAPEALALWLSFRIGAAGEGGAGLIRTAWAARHLAAPPAGDAAAGDAAANGRAGGGGSDGGSDGGSAPPGQAGLQAALAGLGPLHPLTRGCAAFHLWQGLAERPDHLRGLEAAVLAARIAAGEGGLPFLPLALGGGRGLAASGPETLRLAAWLGGARRAVLAALMGLDRLAAWQARAEAATAPLSGRVPPRLIACLAAHPMLSAPEAALATGASRAAVQRNLDLLAARGLIREVTGQGRFRVWTARL